MARTFIYLFGGGATLLLLSLPLADPAHRSLPALLAIAGVAYAIVAVFIVRFDRLPLWCVRAAPAAGTILAGAVIVFSGNGTSAAYAMYLFWVVFSACYFFRAPVAAAHVVLAVAVLGLALLIRPNSLHPTLVLLMAAGTLGIAGGLMIVLRAQLEGLLGRLSAAARTDPLTGLANRRELDSRFAHELARATRTGRALSIVVLDLDYFKEFNDRFGHAAGDRALVTLAAALRRAARGSDVIARLGGEEFAVLAPETDDAQGRILAERVREEAKAAFAQGPERLTASCGVASFPAHGITTRELLHVADRALYRAKEEGRDRTVVYRQEVPADGVEPAAAASSPRLASLLSLAEAVDRRKGTPAHSRRVALYAQALARRTGMSETEVEYVRLAALLRDVGEVGVAEEVLSKSTPLSAEEWDWLRQHPEIGARIVGAAQLGPVGEWILCHHERPDGGGYPRGLSGDQIPIEARILSIADAYSAMTVDRPYRSGLAPARAASELAANAGAQFDQELVEAFLSLVDVEGAPVESEPASVTK